MRIDYFKNMSKLFIIIPIIINSNCLENPPKYKIHLKLKPDLSSFNENSKNKELKKDIESTIDELEGIIKNRCSQMGLSIPKIEIDGENNLIFTIKVVKNPEEIIEEIISINKIEFMFLNNELSDKAYKYFQIFVKSRSQLLSEKDQLIFISRLINDINISNTYKVLYYFEMNNKLKSLQIKYPVVIEDNILLTGKHVKSVWLDYKKNIRNILNILMTKEGAEILSKITCERNYGKELAIIVNGKVRIIGKISSQINNGQFEISTNIDSNFNDIPYRFRTLQLPVKLTVIEKKIEPYESKLKTLYEYQEKLIKMLDKNVEREI